MRKFGEGERKRVVEFVEKEGGVSLTAERGRRKFFLDEAKRQWWILGGRPDKKTQYDGWHAIPMGAMDPSPVLSKLKKLPREEAIEFLKSQGFSEEEANMTIEVLARDVEGTLVVSVWDGQSIHVFHGPLKHLFRQKNSLSKSESQRTYQFNCKIRSGSLWVYGKMPRALFSLSKMGTIPYGK